MERYHCIAVLVVALLGCSQESEKLQNAVLYIIQPPPELPCNPFIREEKYYYGNLAIQCYVAVSKVFLENTDATINLLLFYNQSDEHNRNYLQKLTPDNMIVSEEESFTIYSMVHSVEGFLRGRNEYWCQVFVNREQVYESYTISPSSVTVIRKPSCYYGLPRCTQDIPLGLPMILDAFSQPSTHNEFCTDVIFETASSEPILDMNDSENGTMSCNETASSGNRGLSPASVIVPNVILSVLVVIGAIVLICVLLIYWRHKKLLKYRMKDMSDVVVQRKPYMGPSGYAKHLRGARSLPDLHSSDPSTCTSDNIPDTTTPGLQVHTGKINEYEGIVSCRKTVDSEYIVMGRGRDSTESYSYVTPNRVKLPVKHTKPIVNATTSHQTLSQTQQEMYLTLMDSVEQHQSQHRPTIQNASKDSSCDQLPIYEVIQTLA